jgi:uncharacterized protein YfbU (UPF0304 family)
MTLGRTERLLLYNQYTILQVVDPENRDHYSLLATIISEGYELEYERLWHSIDKPMPSERCRAVLDILQMYRAINDSYSRLSDKSEIDEARVRFQGFDGNNEAEELAYARFTVNRVGRYEEFKEAVNNSHAPLMHWYNDRLTRWKASADPYNLTREDIVRIFEG